MSMKINIYNTVKSIDENKIITNLAVSRIEEILINLLNYLKRKSLKDNTYVKLIKRNLPGNMSIEIVNKITKTIQGEITESNEFLSNPEIKERKERKEINIAISVTLNYICQLIITSIDTNKIYPRNILLSIQSNEELQNLLSQI
jgi:hypothetical protein